MFQYTREFIINEDVKVNAEKVSGIVSLDGIASYKTGKDGNMDRILDVKEIPFEDSVLPVINIAYAAIAGVDQKITVRVELYRATEASYGNNLHAKMSKLFQFEIPAGYTIDQAITLIKDVMRPSDHPYFTVSKNGTNIKITGVEGAQRISAKKYKSTGINAKHEQQWEETATINRVDGKIGHGTYELLMHNNRLPVPEKTGYFSPSKFEMPWPGATYKLIEFVYNSGIRNIGGSGVVGSYDRSMTKHRFWVNTKATLTEFDKAIAALKANAVAENIGDASTRIATTKA